MTASPSDMHLLTRLADPQDAIATVKAGTLLLAERGRGRSISGTALPVIAVDTGEVTNYRVTLAERGTYRSVTASWHDEATSKTRTVTTVTHTLDADGLKTQIDAEAPTD